MSLDLGPLARALSELELFLSFCRETPAESGEPVYGKARAFQAAAIQAFEFSYELCHNMIRRFLEANEATPVAVASLGFPDLIRLAHRRGVTQSDWRAWSQFRDMRNITSHTYDPGKAAEVVAALPAFLAEARGALSRMQDAATP